MNNADLREASHDMAITALRQTPAVVRLVVLRDESQFKDEGGRSFYNSFLTVLVIVSVVVLGTVMVTVVVIMLATLSVTDLVTILISVLKQCR